ncbi:sigma-70 family RNA polymerase sigma factor [Erythrobacter sp.]|uniref:RNA polymerase sigma factor n=1 Tax=Erythrobacter sp. TaxID=1042 RepID=UPI0025E15CC4|nr:sigma-70 family RNA polymerase sigma factor [Erythrobacter sp.]
MNDENPDAALVRGALADEAQAARALVERHREAIYRLARTATGDAEEAFDITQDTFIAAFGALSRYDPARPFRGWIAAIALNKCRDRARRRAVRRFLGLPMPDNAAEWIADDAPSPEAQAASREELATTARAIAELPSALKDVLILRTIEGMSQQETADSLGISAKAVETRLYRARQKLTQMVRGDPRPRV